MLSGRKVDSAWVVSHGLNPQCIVECFQGRPLGTRLNTGFQKAFFNQPVLSTTSRRLFLEEFSLTH